MTRHAASSILRARGDIEARSLLGTLTGQSPAVTEAAANSIEAVIWVAVGGRGTLAGAILGAILVNFGKTWFTSALPEFWLFALGALFIGVTLLLPKGVMGLFAARSAKPAQLGETETKEAAV